MQAARATFSQILGHYPEASNDTAMWQMEVEIGYSETWCENGSKVKRQKHTGAQRPLRFLSGVLCLSSASKRIDSAHKGHRGE